MNAWLLPLALLALAPSPARADGRGDLESTRWNSGAYDGRRDSRDGYYYDARREREVREQKREERREERRERRESRRRPEPPRSYEPSGNSGNWTPSLGQTGGVLAGIGVGVMAGFLTFAVMGTGPFGMIFAAMIGIGAAVGTAYFLK